MGKSAVSSGMKQPNVHLLPNKFSAVNGRKKFYLSFYPSSVLVLSENEQEKKKSGFVNN